MALSSDQKVAIAAHYAPILYFHPDEPYVPIRPESYLKAAALWRGQPPTDQKKDWGEGGPAFPRRPLIPRLGISLDSGEDFEGTADPDKDGVNEWYLGHLHQDGVHPYLDSHPSNSELWLDSSGWKDSQDVTQDSQNDQCNPDEALKKWQEPPGTLARTFSDWYYAEVQETSDFQRLLISVGELDGKSIETITRELLGEIWIAWYYFLYPIHHEYLRRCEQVLEDGSKRGDYEGDWNAVAVVIRRPAVLPWESGGAFDQPLFIGYGVRLRGLGEEFMPDLFKQGMIIRPWNQAPHIGNHPRIFVTKGYHNNYPRAGDEDPAGSAILAIPLPQITCELTEEIDESVNDAKETLEDIGETAKDVVVTIAKIVAGAGIGAGFLGIGAAIGAIAGAVAGIVEALSTSNTDDVPSEEILRELEREPGPPVGKYGLVLKPADIADPLLHDALHPENDETAVTIRTWNGTDKDRLVDRGRQIWWPGELGYNGRWGVRVENDPNNRRSGIPLPDFRRALLFDLAIHLSRTTD